jgi:diguanylate cyclase (GGDEF)-like protein
LTTPVSSVNGGTAPGVEFYCLDAVRLDRFLERRRAPRSFALELSLAENLVEILRRANEFVPSSAGSILLDNPTDKGDHRQRNTLTFIAAFGERSDGLVGQTIAAEHGIAGRVYRTGKAHRTANASADRFFFPGVDEATRYTTQSLVAIPVRIEQEVCGVLELINREGAEEFSQHDTDLLEIFAGYISVSIQNVLDGRQAQEIAKRDNLTGLFNDRYLHLVLTDSIRQAREAEQDLAVLFLDLDYFKRVNDNNGHLAGSQVLREVGHVLRTKVDSPGSIPARYGGDEFVLVVPGAGLGEAVDLAEDIRTEILNRTFCDHETDIQLEPLHLTGITCSIGVATLHRHLNDEPSLEKCRSTLLRLADAAMYVAKETGRNRTAVAGEPVRRRR